MPGFYVPDLTEHSKEIVISGSEFHHLTHVFRKQVDNRIILTNGKGILADALIRKRTKKSATVKIEKIKKFFQSKPAIGLAFSLLRNKHDYLIVEKATELGVKDFFPFISSRTIKKNSRNSKIRFTKTAIAAIKQCDNAFLPEIHRILHLEELLVFIKQLGYRPVAALEIKLDRRIFNLELDNMDPICLVIGPEGGFENKEIDILAEKADCISLGNHVLRAETAAIAAVAQLMGRHLEKNSKYY